MLWWSRRICAVRHEFIPAMEAFALITHRSGALGLGFSLRYRRSAWDYRRDRSPRTARGHWRFGIDGWAVIRPRSPRMALNRHAFLRWSFSTPSSVKPTWWVRRSFQAVRMRSEGKTKE